MSSAIISLLVLGIVVVVTGLFVLGDSQENVHRVIKPSRTRLESRTSSRQNANKSRQAPKRRSSGTADLSLPAQLEDMVTPSDPFERVTTDGESDQARDARTAARDMADTDPARIVHIIRKWRQEDEGRKFR